MNASLIVYVDIDDTLVRSVGAKRIPMPEVVRHVRELARDGATLYAWSSGGADYARASAAELGIEGCFAGFLPKPQVLVDDQSPSDWRRAMVVHPLQAAGRTLADYMAELDGASR
jgi:hypothetical protein